MIELFKEKSLNRNMDEKRIESIIIWGIKLLSFDGSYWQDLNVLWGHTLFFWYFCLLTHSQKLFSGHFFFPVSLIIFKSAVFQIFWLGNISWLGPQVIYIKLMPKLFFVSWGCEACNVLHAKLRARSDFEYKEHLTPTSSQVKDVTICKIHPTL